MNQFYFTAVFKNPPRDLIERLYSADEFNKGSYSDKFIESDIANEKVAFLESKISGMEEEINELKRQLAQTSDFICGS